ncbi:MAG TPA: GTP-binding protein, partial [Methanomassiliicoccaceae archaeon]|nr:GTP-binding protein [Methanomassiliicoccaceae archaeon]
MEMLIVAGFLGSGKTTLVLSAISRIIERTGKKVVIIVGIDGKVMEKYGLKVAEMASGCICCTLGGDLLTTIQDIEDNIKPDLIVIEPTGLADPSAIVDAMQHYPGKPLERIRSAVIIDAARFPSIYKALNRPLTNQVKNADLVLINKIDAVTPDALSMVEAELRTMNADVPMI